MNVWSNIGSASTTSTYHVSSQLSSTDYRCQITIQGPTQTIFFSSTVTVTNAYCAPNVITCTAADTINDFILVGEANSQIYDVATGCSTNAYDNRTSESVTFFVSSTYIAFVSTQYSSSEQFSIWIDFNDNHVFESTEQVAYRLMNSTLDTPVTITIPSVVGGAVIGSHRMRAALAYATTPNPCSASTTYGETQDYTANIMAYTCKLFYF
jgi:hypothetical protein